MFTRNIKDTFTKSLLDAVSGVLGEAKKKKPCEKEEAKEGYIPTNDLPDEHSRKVAGKLGAMLKREREAKEKKEPLGVKTEEVEDLEEKRGLWDNIHAKRERIKRGSGERMRKPGSEGAPTAADFKASQKEEVEIHESAIFAKRVHNVAKHYGFTNVGTGKEKASISHSNGESIAHSHNGSMWVHSGKGGETIKSGSSKDDSLSRHLEGHGYKLKEEVQIDELSDATLKSYSRKALDQSKTLTGDQKVKRQVGARNAIDRLGNNTLAKEEAEQVAEVAPPGAKYERMVKHIKKAYAKDGKLTDKEKSIAYATAWKAKNEAIDPGLEDELMSQRQGESGKKWRVERAGKTISTHNSKDAADTKAMKHPLNKVKANEEVEQIDEWDISKMPHDKLKFHSTVPHGRYTAKEIKDEIKRRKKVGEYKTEEVNIDEAFEQLDELSKATLGSYVKKAAGSVGQEAITAGLKIKAGENPMKNLTKGLKRQKGIETAANKLTKEEQDFIDALNADTLDEARGRPKKAGAKDFTIHPKTKEKLMHNNPEHMAKIEKLQKHGVLQKPKTEANQHIIQQLQRAKTSMRGGETIHFTHGDSTHVAGHHAAKLLDKYAGMKPNEKEAFQKKIGHSHANLKSEL